MRVHLIEWCHFRWWSIDQQCCRWCGSIWRLPWPYQLLSLSAVSVRVRPRVPHPPPYSARVDRLENDSRLIRSTCIAQRVTVVEATPAADRRVRATAAVAAAADREEKQHHDSALRQPKMASRYHHQRCHSNRAGRCDPPLGCVVIDFAIVAIGIDFVWCDWYVSTLIHANVMYDECMHLDGRLCWRRWSVTGERHPT